MPRSCGCARGEAMPSKPVAQPKLHREYSAPDVEPECEWCGERWPCSGVAQPAQHEHQWRQRTGSQALGNAECAVCGACKGADPHEAAAREWLEQNVAHADPDQTQVLAALLREREAVAERRGAETMRERAASKVEDHGHRKGRIRGSHKHLAKAIRGLSLLDRALPLPGDK